MAPGDEHAEFRSAVEASQLQDPMPALRNLSAATGIPVERLVHHALVRWTAAGAELLMAAEPMALRDLAAACERRDWNAVEGIVSWLAAGGR